MSGGGRGWLQEKRAVGEGRAGQLFAEEIKFPLSPLHIHVVDLAVKSQFCFAFLTDFTGLIMWKNW